MKRKWWQKPSVIKEQVRFYEKNVPDFDTLEDGEKAELRLISEEMAYVLIYRVLQELDPIEKYIIRHQFGLPKDYNRGDYYPVKSRLQLSEMLKDHPYFKSLKHKDDHQLSTHVIRKRIKHIRERALKKMFCYLWYNDQYKKEVKDLI
jgi:hypothetical protein